MIAVRLSLTAALALLGGCSITGFSNSFDCNVKSDGICASLSTAYEKSNRRELPSQRAATAAQSAAAPAPAALAPGQISPAQMQAPSSGAPLRIQPTILRVWVAPWEDDLGALRDQSYAYLTIDPGRWVVETNRAAIRNQYRAVYPLQRQEADPATTRDVPRAVPQPAPAPMPQSSTPSGQER